MSAKKLLMMLAGAVLVTAGMSGWALRQFAQHQGTIELLLSLR